MSGNLCRWPHVSQNSALVSRLTAVLLWLAASLPYPAGGGGHQGTAAVRLRRGRQDLATGRAPSPDRELLRSWLRARARTGATCASSRAMARRSRATCPASHRPRRLQQGLLEHALQLAHVPRPRIAPKQLQRRRRHAPHLLVQLPAEPPDKVVRQQRQVLAALA